MLVFFNCNETTSILGTNKVKTVLDGDKLVEGKSVMVDYGNAEYKAKVLKLHGKKEIYKQFPVIFFILSRVFSFYRGYFPYDLLHILRERKYFMKWLFIRYPYAKSHICYSYGVHLSMRKSLTVYEIDASISISITFNIVLVTP